MPWEPDPSVAPSPKPGARGRRLRLGGTAVVVVAVLAGGGVGYVELTDSPNWYATGKSVELALEQQNDSFLTGPVSALPTACTAKMNAAQSGQRPANTDKAAVKLWLQGCEAAYHQKHPNQVVEDGIMWPSGTKPCNKSCSSQQYAAGKSIALAADEEPLVHLAAGTSGSPAADWCADLMSNQFIQPLPVSVESRLHAHTPVAGPATYSWDQGCAAVYQTMQANGGPAQPGAPVTVTGAYGAAPNMTIPAKTAPSSFYVKTLYQGTGATVTTSEGMVGNYVAYDWSGITHKLLASSFTEGTPAFFAGQLLPGLQKALIGQTVGSRVVTVLTAADAFGSAGYAQEGVGANDSLVFVVDINSSFATASVPGKQTSDGGGALPTVTPSAPGSIHGPTTITIPRDVTPPATLQVKTLIHGTGPVVAQGQTIAVQYTGVIWRTGQVFNSSWQNGDTPFITPIGTGQVIKGWDTGLVGQTVGSRVLLVVPPADSYGSAGQPQIGLTGTDTLVFVVDILAAS
jgi:FKBP-type peptidyl-prolyl cis-trans isomerase